MNEARWDTKTDFQQCALTNVTLGGVENVPEMLFDIDTWLLAEQQTGHIERDLFVPYPSLEYTIYVPEREEIFATVGNKVVKAVPDTEQVEESPTLPTIVYDLCYDPTEDVLFVADNTNDRIYKVSPDSLDVIDTLIITNPYTIVTGGGYLYVGQFPASPIDISKVRTSDFSVVDTYTHDQLGQVSCMGLSLDDATLYVAGPYTSTSRLWKIDTGTMTRLVDETTPFGYRSPDRYRLVADEDEQYLYCSYYTYLEKINCSDCTSNIRNNMGVTGSPYEHATFLLGADHILVVGGDLGGRIHRRDDLSLVVNYPLSVGDPHMQPCYDSKNHRAWLPKSQRYMNLAPVYAQQTGEVVSDVRHTEENITFGNLLWDAEAAYAGGLQRPRASSFTPDVNIDKAFVGPNGEYVYYLKSSTGIIRKMRLSDRVEVDSIDTGDINYSMKAIDRAGDYLYAGGRLIPSIKIRTSDMTVVATCPSSYGQYNGGGALSLDGQYIYFGHRDQFCRKLRTSDMVEVDVSTVSSCSVAIDDSTGYIYTNANSGSILYRLDPSDMSAISTDTGVTLNWEPDMAFSGGYLYLSALSGVLVRVQLDPFGGTITTLSPTEMLICNYLVVSPSEEHLYVFGLGTTASKLKGACFRIKIPEFYVERAESVDDSQLGLSNTSDESWGFIREGSTILIVSTSVYGHGLVDLEVEG